MEWNGTYKINVNQPNKTKQNKTNQSIDGFDLIVLVCGLLESKVESERLTMGG